ncbi:hypothetical protein G7054_g4341 [Neopestalotiopsis clavispora]|nr:hypothetical protein G7054_g4341 [Neopestalotiopsis clavispora]
MPNISPLVSNFTFVQLDPFDYTQYVNMTNSTATHPRPKRAMQCTMRLCARIFETPYYGNFSAGPFTGSQVDLVTSTQGSSPTVPLLGNIPIFLGLQPSTNGGMPPNTTFRINYCDYSSLIDYTTDLFKATMNSQGVVGSNLHAETDDNSLGSAFDPTPDRTTPNVGLALSQANDIPALMQQIADSITEEMRISVNSSSTNGVAMNSEVFIAINWAWLALPISVTILTFVLLLVVIITNHARNMPPWRSSSLALLFHEVDGWDSSEMIVSGPEDMAARAKDMKGQVTYEEDLLLFTKAE